ncbi:MAG: hypothetical protein EAZ09_04425 [Oscillatoriales cyanobacterium]|nr:MAG: hypothetical protein EAZ18_13890 [Oscillatoriales cyanobacterium]TAH24366.1 MAG: hypothetical protein EAZ09_04425 [Oscillatoriales cyanobacterium]
MIRRYIASISINILKRTCATATVLALTVGCSSTKPLNTAVAEGAIASAVQSQPLEPLLPQNSKKPKKFVNARSCAQNDGFSEAISFATEASNLAQSANSKQDWDEVAALWVQAVAWMQAVPLGSPKRAFAEKKVVEYMKNLTYSQQQAGATIQTSASFSSDLFNQQLELYLSYVATVGPPDVLIVGSSRALQGVDPKQLKQSLAASGNPGLTIFNFAVNGATAQVVDFQLRRLLKPQQLPQMIVWADGVRAFNSGRIDRTFNSIIASEGNQLLAAGIRPKLSEDEPSVIPQCYKFPQPCRGSFQKANILLVANIAVGGQDAHPTKQLKSCGTGILPVAKISDCGTGILPVANTALTAIRPISELADAIDSNGFMSLSARYNPNTYYNDRAYVSGRFDRDYEDFNLGGKQAKAFNSVITFVKSRKIPLVFVNLPLTDDYLDGTRRYAEQQFRQQMQQLSRQKGFAFRDLSQRWQNRNEYFFDPSHLNQFGAIAVSRLIAADTSITWPRPKSRVIDG